MKLKELIGYDYRRGQFVVGSHDLAGNRLEASAQTGATEADVNEFLAQLATGPDLRENHELLAANIVEPIEQVVPYVEQFRPFFMDQSYGPLEDNSIPIEDTVAIAWQTHQDSAVLFVRSGFSWTRPEFDTWDEGIEVPWDALKKAGWNFLERQMRRAAEALARKRDEVARNVLLAAMQPSHIYTITGGHLTKAGIDTVLKDQAAIGFPVQRVLLNPATLMEMGNFNWGGTGNNGFLLPPEEARDLLRTLHIMNYGGAEWYTNPFALTTEVIYAGAPSQIGWHQIRGEMKTASDVDIRNKADLHVMIDQEHSWYVGNAYTLAKSVITA